MYLPTVSYPIKSKLGGIVPVDKSSCVIMLVHSNACDHIVTACVGSHAATKKGIQRMKSVVGTPYYIAPEVLKADSSR